MLVRALAGLLQHPTDQPAALVAVRVAQVVLGAYYGTGKKGGIMSTFLMGVYDEARKVWLTVCKVGNGHDDATLDRLNKPGVLKVRGRVCCLFCCPRSPCHA